MDHSVPLMFEATFSDIRLNLLIQNRHNPFRIASNIAAVALQSAFQIVSSLRDDLMPRQVRVTYPKVLTSAECDSLLFGSSPVRNISCCGLPPSQSPASTGSITQTEARDSISHTFYSDLYITQNNWLPTLQLYISITILFAAINNKSKGRLCTDAESSHMLPQSS